MTHPYTKQHPHAVETVKREYASKILQYRTDILLFVYDMWGLEPQGVKPEYADKWRDVMLSTGDTWLRLKEEVDVSWFGDLDYVGQYGEKYYTYHNFVKGKHISWQQVLILLAFQKAMVDSSLSRHISVRSGHGIGKSAVTSWLILWFLFCFFMSQVPVTAPTAGQMHDVLWKELSIWLSRMKSDDIKELFEWQHDYVRMKYDPAGWFARAKTSSKENTEALAGVHADNVFLAADEASGVPEQVYNAAEGALTSGNVYVMLISNPTRPTGYFYDSHHKNATDWQTFNFNCEEAPLVDRQYVERQAKRHGVTSDEYNIRVKGNFPSEDMMDDTGYLQLVPRNRITVEPSLGHDLFVGGKTLAIDPSGEGDDECEFILRDAFRAKSILTLHTTNDKEIANWIIKFAAQYNLTGKDIVIEGFGKGADAAKHVAVETKGKLSIYVVLPGNKPEEEERLNGEHFIRMPDEMDVHEADILLNLRMTANWRMRKWLFAGGTIIDNNTENSDFAEQIAVNKYKRTQQGNKLQMMPKKEMKKNGIPSPNKSDALALSFLNVKRYSSQSKEERAKIISEQQRVVDKFAVL